MKDLLKKNKKWIIIIAIALAFIVGLIVVLVNVNNGNFNKGNSERYNATTYTLKDNAPMKDKKMIFIGSNFTMGKYSKGQSFVDYLGVVDGIDCVTYTSADAIISTSKDNSLINQLISIPKDTKNLRAVFIEIPYAQAKGTQNIGTMTDSYYLGDFNTSTFIGAMEYMISYAKITYGCPIVFYTCTNNGNKKYAQLVSVANEVAQKWNVDIIDFYNNDSIDTSDNLYFVKKNAPTKAGYNELIAPEFENFMEEHF